MYEYKAVPLVVRAPSLRYTGDRVAEELTPILNYHAGQGWEFMRAEAVAVETRKTLLILLLNICTLGLYQFFLSRIKRHNEGTVLVFRRSLSK